MTLRLITLLFGGVSGQVLPEQRSILLHGGGVVHTLKLGLKMLSPIYFSFLYSAKWRFVGIPALHFFSAILFFALKEGKSTLWEPVLGSLPLKVWRLKA